jgi:hypothetical protein
LSSHGHYCATEREWGGVEYTDGTQHHHALDASKSAWKEPENEIAYYGSNRVRLQGHLNGDRLQHMWVITQTGPG